MLTIYCGKSVLFRGIINFESYPNAKKDPSKAFFFVRKVIENSWGRDMLLNFLNTDLYERQAKAITNFNKMLPALQSDLALGISQYELTKLIPNEIKSFLPSIEEIESTLEQLSENNED